MTPKTSEKNIHSSTPASNAPTMVTQDEDTRRSLERLSHREQIQTQRIPGVETVLVVLSSKAMVFDVESLRYQIYQAYPGSTIGFCTTSGRPLEKLIRSVDLLIDFTGPGQRQAFWLPFRFRRMARVVVGRNAGLFRKLLYHRLYDEKKSGLSLPNEILERERKVQKEVLALAGVAFLPAGQVPEDLGRKIALELPRLSEQ